MRSISACTAVGAYYAHALGGECGNAAADAGHRRGALALLIVLLLAEWPLRRLRVFISKHFYRNKYDYRIEWLRFVQTLSMRREPDARRNAIRAVAQIFDSTSGLLSFASRTARQLLSAGGLARQERAGSRDDTPIAR